MVHHNNHQQENNQTTKLNLGDLFKLAIKNRDLKRKLTQTLGQILVQQQQQQSNSNSDNHNNSVVSDNYQQSTNNEILTDYLISANLSQLAKINEQFNELASEELILFANEPSLDDKLLFPQLSNIIKSLNQYVTSNNQQENDFLIKNLLFNNNDNNNFTLIKNELNYCHYVKQLYWPLQTTTNTEYDQLNLLQYKNGLFRNKIKLNFFNETSSMLSNKFWHREDNSDNNGKKSYYRRLMTSLNFNHLYNLNSIIQLLDHNNKITTNVDDLDDGDDDDDDYSSNRQQQNRSIIMNSMASSGSTSIKRQINHNLSSNVASNEHQEILNAKEVVKRSSMVNGDQYQQLLNLLSSYDIMFGYFNYYPASSSIMKQQHDKNILKRNKYINVSITDYTT